MDDCEQSDSSEEFYDACEDQVEQATCSEMDIEQSLVVAELAINYFFDNRFEEARTLLKPFADSSLYHSMGNAVFAFLEAMLTFEHIEEASSALRKCIDLCQRYRKKITLTASIGNTFKKRNFNQLTDLECHAELCLAESLLMNALLTFIGDENLTGLIRGSLQVRQCFNCYRTCEQIMKHRNWSSNSTALKIHFNSGVLMGIGTFNLMISLLPGRLIKLLQFIGFTSDRSDGLRDLQKGHQENGLRQILCKLSLLGYHLMVVPMISDRQSTEHLKLCDQILTSQLAKYPSGVWMLFFKGRYELVTGNLKAAEILLLWLSCVQRNWPSAENYARQLLDKSNWSRSIYAYQLAAIKLMSSDNLEVDKLMLEVVTFKQKIAGKSLPMEKFMAKRSLRYKIQNGQLVLPLIELMYLWNVFKFMGQDYQLADGILQIIDADLAKFNSMEPSDLLYSTSHSYYADNRALCLLLRGSCYKQMGKLALALQDFNECILQTGIVEDHFIIPYAYYEAALCHAAENRDLAVSMLHEIKKKYSKFALESRLYFRIHAALMDLER
ncbi:hypothetical protein ACLKA6_012761 [Drosophila palustris]